MSDDRRPNPRQTRVFAAAVAKHLPPSAAALRLVDAGMGGMGAILAQMRPEIVLSDLADESDAVVAYHHPPDAALLSAALRSLRSGGRLIVVLPGHMPSRAYVDQLEAAGYTRILVEAALDQIDPAQTDEEAPLSAAPPVGVLIRGEKPHTTADTLARVSLATDAAPPDISSFSGRFFHLLIRQTPNQPIWARAARDPIQWEAVAQDGKMLAFTSLPNAVSFMQSAVLAGKIVGVNKIAKFKREIAAAWAYPLWLNPPVAALAAQPVTFISVDPASAEQPDE